MTSHECELCGQHVLPVGETPLHYEQAPEQLTRPGEEGPTQVLSEYVGGVIDRLYERVKSLERTVLEQTDQIEALSAECERYKRALWDVIAVEERLAEQGIYQSHEDGESYRIAKRALGCPAGEE